MAVVTESWNPVFHPMSNCYTTRNKYPRTTYLVDYVDRTKMGPKGVNIYSNPTRPCYPPVPLARFRPMHPGMDPELVEEVRLTNHLDPRGRKTPKEAFHWGYRVFSLDPTKRTLRHFNDPIPYSLTTTKRASYTDPHERPHLIYRPTVVNERHAALGIAPEVMVSAYPLVVDTSWSKDYVYESKCPNKFQDKK